MPLAKASYLEMTHVVLCLPVLSLGGQEWPSLLAALKVLVLVIWLSQVITSNNISPHRTNKKNFNCLFSKL